jgi:hypothetical protein
MDLMAQGGAPPEEAPPEMGAADPMAALMGAAPGPEAAPPGADPYAGTPGPESAGPAEGDGGDESSDYQDAITALTSALNRPTTDQQEMAEIQKCIAAIQGLLGKNEKALDSAMGTSPQLRKALAGGGA